MKRRTVGVVDYGVGNVASVLGTVQSLGHRCRISSDPQALEAADLLVLPGVGAFPRAMDHLRKTGLAEHLQVRAREERPIIGICLGMHLMMDASSEQRLTAGLGLIPGQVVSLDQAPWHIGWNTIEVVSGDPLLRPSDGEAFYFNHSYVLDVPPEYQLSLTRLDRPFVTAVRRGNVVGVQFHPEKSQQAGRQLLQNLIEGLCGD